MFDLTVPRGTDSSIKLHNNYNKIILKIKIKCLILRDSIMFNWRLILKYTQSVQQKFKLEIL